MDRFSARMIIFERAPFPGERCQHDERQDETRPVHYSALPLVPDEDEKSEEHADDEEEVSKPDEEEDVVHSPTGPPLWYVLA
jgi:hypothetical protein